MDLPALLESSTEKLHVLPAVSPPSVSKPMTGLPSWVATPSNFSKSWLESAVVGIDSDIEGGEQEVMACIVLTEDARKKPHEAVFMDLLSHCDRRMPKFAVPRFVRRVESLPKTPTEKVQKKVLRDAGITDDTWDRERSG